MRRGVPISGLGFRIPTAEAKRPIILLNHMDVVTSDASHWKIPPFSGDIKDGYLWGRGAQDMKDEGLAQLVTLIMLKREKVSLDRDVIFLAVSDEEAEGTGTDWFIAHHRDLLENAEFLINEGGENRLENGEVKYVGVDVGEKTTFWLHMVAHGRPGHGSRPNPDSAPNRLVRALDRILAYRTPLRVLPVVDEFLRDMAAYQPNRNRYARQRNFYPPARRSAEPVPLFENCLRTMFRRASTVGLSRLGFEPMSIEVQWRERTVL
jgi:acetylornithine deacetylase/succinyl-diaminopimelate desuccinylase-like protein